MKKLAKSFGTTVLFLLVAVLIVIAVLTVIKAIFWLGGWAFLGLIFGALWYIVHTDMR